MLLLPIYTAILRLRLVVKHLVALNREPQARRLTAETTTDSAGTCNTFLPMLRATITSYEAERQATEPPASVKKKPEKKKPPGPPPTGTPPMCQCGIKTPMHLHTNEYTQDTMWICASFPKCVLTLECAKESDAQAAPPRPRCDHVGEDGKTALTKRGGPWGHSIRCSKCDMHKRWNKSLKIWEDFVPREERAQHSSSSASQPPSSQQGTEQTRRRRARESIIPPRLSRQGVARTPPAPPPAGPESFHMSTPRTGSQSLPTDLPTHMETEEHFTPPESDGDGVEFDWEMAGL